MFPQYPAAYIHDGDGNVPPEFGGTVAVKFYAFTYQTASGQRAFTLPAGATIVGFDLVVNTIFNNAPTLSVGDDASASSYLSAASVLGTAGPVFSTAWVTLNKWFSKLSSPVNVKLVIGGTPSAGAAVLACRYVMQ